jgi:hypothetical protein
MRNLVIALFLLLSTGTCLADAQFSIVRELKQGGATGTHTIALVCGKDQPELADCKVFRATNGVTEKSIKLTPATASEIFTAAEKKLKGSSRTPKKPDAGFRQDTVLRWNLAYQGKARKGTGGGKESKSLAPLMTLEQRLIQELDKDLGR